jgi:hypothetical protein
LPAGDEAVRGGLVAVLLGTLLSAAGAPPIFSDDLDTAFSFAIVACLVAAASMMRGGRYHHADEPQTGPDHLGDRWAWRRYRLLAGPAGAKLDSERGRN